MSGSLVERLGFAARDRVAVVHVDDLGMCHASNDGGFEALERGPATCGSVMVPCPWFPEAAARARANPRLDLGVHLTLNAEWEGFRWGPVAGGEVPSLVDEGGYLPRTAMETVRKARAEEVAIELRAQVDRALAAGIDVTHLDAHMGTVLFPPLLDVYAGLARAYRVPVFAARPRREQLEARGLAAAEPVFRRLSETLESDGFPVMDAFDSDSLGFAPGEGLAHNRRRIERLGPGVTYLICHAARGGPELEAIMPGAAHAREFERTFYGGEAGRELLREQGVKTVGMRALRDLLRSA